MIERKSLFVRILIITYLTKIDPYSYPYCRHAMYGMIHIIYSLLHNQIEQKL